MTEILVASRGDGDVGKGFEASQRLEYRLEGETPLLEELEKWSRMHESSWKRTGCRKTSALGLGVIWTSSLEIGTAVVWVVVAGVGTLVVTGFETPQAEVGGAKESR